MQLAQQFGERFYFAMLIIEHFVQIVVAEQIVVAGVPPLAIAS